MGNSKFEKMVRKVYYKNPVSYRVAQDFKSELNMLNLFKTLAVLPAIPLWNYLAEREMAAIGKRGSVYCIQNGRLLYYLPELNFRGGGFYTEPNFS